MRITDVFASGLKGRGFSFAPAAVNLITGPNFSGKSAVKDALLLGLLGYHPALGKKNDAIFGLGGGSDGLQVQLNFDNGAIIDRTWRESKGSVKAEGFSDLQTPPVMLDLAVLFNMTKAARLQYIFGLVDASAHATRESVIAEIKALKINEPTEETETVLGELVPALGALPAGETIQDWLAAAAKHIKDSLQVQNASARDLQAFSRVQIQIADADTPVNNAQARVTAARNVLSAAEQKLADSQRECGAYADLQRKHDAMQAGGGTDHDAEIGKAQKSLDEANANLASYDPSSAALLSDARSKETGLRRDLETSVRRLDGLRAEVRTWSDKSAQLAKAVCCPTCGADGTTWKDKLLAEYAAQAEAAQVEAENEESAQMGIVAELEAVAAEIVALKDAVAFGEAAEQDVRRFESYVRVTTMAKAGDATKAAQRTDLEAKLAASDAGQLATAEQSAQSAVDTARDALREADAALRDETAARTKLRDTHRSQMNYKKAAAAVVVLKAAGVTVQDIQKRVIAAAFGPLLERARLFTDGILKAPLDFHEGEIGYWDGGSFVAHTTFSGTEEALAYAGLSVALAVDSPVKVVIIDEMGRFDPLSNRPLVIRRMRDLVEQGHIDHFFGMDSDETFAARYGDLHDVLVYSTRQILV